MMMDSLKYMEIVCSVIVIAAAVCSLMVLLLMTRIDHRAAGWALAGSGE